MNSWLFRSLVALYPKAWRERYSKEVGDLSAELLAAGETTRLRITFELTRSALAERVRSLHRGRLVVVLSSCAALVLTLESALLIGGVFQGQPRPSPSPVVISAKQAEVTSVTPIKVNEFLQVGPVLPTKFTAKVASVTPIKVNEFLQVGP